MSEMLLRRGLIVITCLALQSVGSSAEFAGGTGEPNDPYQIAAAEQLVAIGSDPNLLDKHFVLVADIDLDPNLPGGKVFTDAVIAQDESEGVGSHNGASFEGVFDGAGHAIANLHVEGVYGYDAGLFGILAGIVKDLRLTDAVVSGSPCGAIAGLNHRGGLILRCEVTGRISGVDDVGGVAGSNWDASLVECRAQVEVTGDDSVGGLVGGGPGGRLLRCRVQGEISGNRHVGGLVGSQVKGPVVECLATGTVIGSRDVGGLIGYVSDVLVLRCSADCDVTADYTAGGLVGKAAVGSGPLISDSYARGSVAGSAAAGLVGETRTLQVVNCYAACIIIGFETDGKEPIVGGLFGNALRPYTPTIAMGSFWDSELAPIAIGSDSGLWVSAKGLTTAQMFEGKEFRDAGWDFNCTWAISEGDYPRLRWQADDSIVQVMPPQ